MARLLKFLCCFLTLLMLMTLSYAAKDSQSDYKFTRANFHLYNHSGNPLTVNLTSNYQAEIESDTLEVNAHGINIGYINGVNRGPIKALLEIRGNESGCIVPIKISRGIVTVEEIKGKCMTVVKMDEEKSMKRLQTSKFLPVAATAYWNVEVFVSK